MISKCLMLSQGISLPEFLKLKKANHHAKKEIYFINNLQHCIIIYILTNEEFYKIVNILYLKNYKCHCHLKIIH